MSRPLDENLFTGPIGAEYRMLELICPNAAVLARRVAERVAGWREGEALEALEIGCGSGVSTLPLLAYREDLHLTAIDSAAKMLDQARSHLSAYVDAGRVAFVEVDALTSLRALPEASLDVISSNYAIHNFLDDYRHDALAAAFRALKSGGLLLNGDRYAMDDRAAHLASTQAEVRSWFDKLGALGRYDLLEDWIAHLFSDESPEHIMYLTPALARLEALGFTAVSVEYREGVDTLVTAVKP
ncbi:MULTISPECIES: class I SAM-dependent methyltransferase [Methylosinus]|uniref:Class I SAM-dependent methyltransferase n=1 Tax=Methylosinus trichosporium (strain ATCC 35070 / NCIMB 11131 / UNIQEM 75 / OB3b) TaxID=595536 RepID=A0A2D2CZ69_METT3|nr:MULTISPECIES: class I SAM-dependent methyltransferase [Methylosinus]ATQ68036.1 class I SAM-dependent methyltransferase [Methylosinus trichosporium OB3b]